MKTIGDVVLNLLLLGVVLLTGAVVAQGSQNAWDVGLFAVSFLFLAIRVVQGIGDIRERIERNKEVYIVLIISPETAVTFVFSTKTVTDADILLLVNQLHMFLPHCTVRSKRTLPLPGANINHVVEEYTALLRKMGA